MPPEAAPSLGAGQWEVQPPSPPPGLGADAHGCVCMGGGCLLNRQCPPHRSHCRCHLPGGGAVFLVDVTVVVVLWVISKIVFLEFPLWLSRNESN